MRTLRPRPVLGLLIVALCACSDPRDRDPRNGQRRCRTLARSVHVDGPVTVLMRDTGWKVHSFEQQKLCLGDRIATGGGRASVAFNGGASLQLGPASTLVLREHGADLIGGRMTAKTVEGSKPIDVKTPMGIATLSTRLSEMSISVDQGFVVEVGQVDVLSLQKVKQTVQSGQALSVEGLVMGLPKAASRRPSAASREAAAATVATSTPELEPEPLPMPDEEVPEPTPPPGLQPAATAPAPTPTPEVEAAPERKVKKPAAPEPEPEPEPEDEPEAAEDADLERPRAPPKKPLPTLSAFTPPQKPQAPNHRFIFTSVAGAQVLRTGQSAWSAVGRQTTVQTGDRLWANRRGAEVALGQGAQMSLQPLAQADLTALSLYPKGGSEWDVAPRAGLSRLKIPAAAHRARLMTLHVGGRTLQLRPTVAWAQMEIEHAEKNPLLVLHFGEVSLDGNLKVEAGAKVALLEDQTLRIEPLDAQAIDVVPRDLTLVNFVARPPSLRFVWETQAAHDGPQMVWELAQDAKFRRVVAAERLRRGSFTVTDLPAGRYFWRVGGATKRISSVRLVKEQQLDCKGCGRSSQVADTGGQAMVYFQEKLPQITLSWAPVPRAALYVFKLYSDGNLDVPVFAGSFSDLNHSFGRGQFVHEGRYFWQVSAVSASGELLNVGKMNTLVIHFDNAIASLKLRAPKDHAVIDATADAFFVTGEAELGSRVNINGQPVALSEQGRFNKHLSLPRGAQRVVVRSLGRDGVERVYLRDIKVK